MEVVVVYSVQDLYLSIRTTGIVCIFRQLCFMLLTHSHSLALCHRSHSVFGMEKPKRHFS